MLKIEKIAQRPVTPLFEKYIATRAGSAVPADRDRASGRNVFIVTERGVGYTFYSAVDVLY